MIQVIEGDLKKLNLSFRFNERVHHEETVSVYSTTNNTIADIEIRDAIEELEELLKILKARFV
jgi:hypothetical protein